jgi:hypothetical protein
MCLKSVTLFNLQKYQLPFHGVSFPLNNLPISYVFSSYLGCHVDKPNLISQLEQEDKVMTEERGILPDTCPGEH